MFIVTKAAAAQIRRSLSEHEFEDMPLRIAVQRADDDSFHYQIGFDEAGPGDTMIASSGIDVVIAKEHKPLLSGTTLDYAVVDSDAEGDALKDASQANFIFLNPNDPNFVPPQDDSPNDSTADTADD